MFCLFQGREEDEWTVENRAGRSLPSKCLNLSRTLAAQSLYVYSLKVRSSPPAYPTPVTVERVCPAEDFDFCSDIFLPRKNTFDAH